MKFKKLGNPSEEKNGGVGGQSGNLLPHTPQEARTVNTANPESNLKAAEQPIYTHIWGRNEGRTENGALTVKCCELSELLETLQSSSCYGTFNGLIHLG